MLPIRASKVLMVDGVEADARMAARARRLRRGIRADVVRAVGDAELAAVAAGELAALPRHGMDGDPRPVVIFNRFRFGEAPGRQRRRLAAYPALDAWRLAGYGGFDWRESGSPAWRRRHGLVCQSAWHLHAIVGCHFRCAYCNFGHFLNIMMNVEEFVARLDGWMRRCPRQTLFQYDNYTDAVCFEPEYGGARLLVEHFARRPGRTLELYVGKSNHVDFLLDYDHRGRTLCCWSLSAETQSRRLEAGSAPMERRIEAMRRCQEAGYPVRVRLSPIIPVRDWRRENRRMIRLLFDRVRPDLVTMEPLRFLDAADLHNLMDRDLLDPAFLRRMDEAQGAPYAQGCEVPEDYRREIYAFFFQELARVSPDTPVAFCREKRAVWSAFADEFARRGQHPDRYVCNCGPTSDPATVAARAQRNRSAAAAGGGRTR